MPLKLIVGLGNAGKTGVIMRDSLSAAAAGESPVIVVPGLSDVRRLERELATKAHLGVRVTTLRRLKLELWQLFGDGRRPVGDAGRRAVLGSVVADGVPADLLAAAATPGFPGFLARLARESDATGPSCESASPTLRALDVLLQRYRETLLAEGLLEEGWLAELIAGANPVMPGLVAFARFDTVPGTELPLIVALSRTGSVRVALTWAPHEAATRANDLLVSGLAAIAEEIVRLEEPTPQTEIEHVAAGLYKPSAGVQGSGAVVLGLAAGEEAEVALAAKFVSAELTQGVAPERIVVAFPDITRRAASLRRALASLEVPADISYSQKFSATSFGRSYLGIVSLALGVGGRVDALEYIVSPYSGIDPSEARALDRGWRRNRTNDPRRLLSAIRRAGSHAESAARSSQALAEGDLSAERAREWQGLADAMLAIALSGEATGPDETGLKEAATAHGAVIKTIDDLLTQTVDLRSPLEVLDALSGTRIRLGQEDAPGRVQVCEMRAVGSRRFDVVILGGLTEAELPLGEDTSASGLHHEDEATAGAEHADRRRLEFYSLMTRARDKLYLLRQEVDSEGRGVRPSALLEDALDTYRAAGAAFEDEGLAPPRCERLARSDIEHLAPTLTYGRVDQRVAAPQRSFGLPPREVISTDAGLAALGHLDTFSATEIETYLECPYRWFHSRVVAPEEIDAALDARELGSHAHRLLAEFYRRTIAEGEPERVTPESLDHAMEVLEHIVLEDSGNQTKADGLPEELSLARSTAWARNVIGQDAHYLPGFVPAHVELGFGVEARFDFAGWAFRGKIDRVDVAPHGAFVTDYKSSRDVPGIDKFESRAKVQAVVYACAAQELLGTDVCGSVYRSMRSGRLRGFWRSDLLGEMPPGLCEDDALDAAGFAELVDRTKLRVSAAIEGMRAGRIPRQAAVPGACGYCPIAPFCERARR